MGLLDRLGRKSANSISVNEVDKTLICKPFLYDFKSGHKNYAAFFINIILTRIFNAMRNIGWCVTETNWQASEIVSFVERNCNIIIYQYWANGYSALFYDKNLMRLRLPKQNEIRLDQYGMVINRDAIVIYSEPYQTQRLSHFKIVKPLMDNINVNMNSSDFVSANSGLFGIISGKGIPMSPAAKDELNDKIRRDYGTDNDQYNFILSNSELSYTPINIPVGDLKFDEKTYKSVCYLCNFFGISADYIFGGSTFSNQEGATRNFYRECVIPIAEVLLMLSRAVFTRISVDLIPSRIITYNITNVPEMNTALSTESNERKAYLEYLIALRDAGIDVSSDIERLYKSSTDMINNI